MMIRIAGAIFTAAGFMFFLMAKMFPFFAFFFFDWIGIIFMAMSMFMILFCFAPSSSGVQYDTIPAGSAVVNYIRRDGIIVPLVGKRVFSGESFLDIPMVGLIEDLGKDTVFLWGRKKVRFGLENINYTPDPRYWNVTRELYHLGFDDTDDLYNVLNIPNITDKQVKAFYLERMANIYWMLTHDDLRGKERLMTIFKKKRDKISFGKKRSVEQKESIVEGKTSVKKDDTIEEMNRWLNSRK